MTQFCGFDLDRVAALQSAVSSAADAGSALSRDVGSTVDDANVVINAAIGHSRIGFEPSYDTDPDRIGARTVGNCAPDVAAEIGRRLTHLRACEALAHAGFQVDPNGVFDDTPAPDATKIKAALSALATVGDGVHQGSSGQLTGLIGDLDGMTPEEVRIFFDATTPTQLANLNTALSLGNVPVFDMGATNDQRTALANALLPALTATQLSRLGTQVPSLDPDLSGVVKNDPITYLFTGAPLYGPGGASVEDINQGEDGDCWFLSALGAELRQDPQFVADHLHDNGNGTYTVTFYRGGQPVPVTVSGALPTDTNGNHLPFVHGAPDWSTGGPAWIAIYEKAFAQFKGSYSDINGGDSSNAFAALSGSGSSLSSSWLNLGQLQKLLSAGAPISVATVPEDTGALWWAKHRDRVDGTKIVTGHEYMIESIDTTVHPPTITVRNPWGSAGGAPEFVTLTQDEFKKYFDEVSFGGN